MGTIETNGDSKSELRIFVRKRCLGNGTGQEFRTEKDKKILDLVLTRLIYLCLP